MNFKCLLRLISSLHLPKHFKHRRMLLPFFEPKFAPYFAPCGRRRYYKVKLTDEIKASLI